MIDHLRGFAIIVGFFFLGLRIHSMGFPIPGGVIGLLVFYLAMSAGLVKLQWVEKTADLLLRHMVLMFVPLTVGLMEMGAVLSQQARAIVASLVVSTTAVVLTTGMLGNWLFSDKPVLPESMVLTTKHELEDSGQ
jgi:holin-like protein